MSKNAKRIAIGAMMAGAMGYVAGILTAPKSGMETRKTIRNASDMSVAEVEKQLKVLHTELSKLLIEAADQTKRVVASSKNVDALEAEVIGHATRVRQKTREILSALHDGNADDKDLDKAVVEATKAIKSIRSY